MPDAADGEDFCGGPQAGDAVVVDQRGEGIEVVGVDVFEGGGRVVGACEGEVAGAPFLGEVGPVDAAGCLAERACGGGGGGGVEGVVGFRGKVVGYCGAPVDDRAEDLEGGVLDGWGDFGGGRLTYVEEEGFWRCVSERGRHGGSIYRTVVMYGWMGRWLFNGVAQ